MKTAVTIVDMLLDESIEEYAGVVKVLLGAWAVRTLYRVWLDPEHRKKLVQNWGLLKNDAKALWRFLNAPR